MKHNLKIGQVLYYRHKLRHQSEEIREAVITEIGKKYVAAGQCLYFNGNEVQYATL